MRTIRRVIQTERRAYLRHGLRHRRALIFLNLLVTRSTPSANYGPVSYWHDDRLRELQRLAPAINNLADFVRACNARYLKQT